MLILLIVNTLVLILVVILLVNIENTIKSIENKIDNINLNNTEQQEDIFETKN